MIMTTRMLDALSRWAMTLPHAFNHAAAVDGIETPKHKPAKPKASQLVRTADS